jgi:hypothetical protein
MAAAGEFVRLLLQQRAVDGHDAGRRAHRRAARQQPLERALHAHDAAAVALLYASRRERALGLERHARQHRAAAARQRRRDAGLVRERQQRDVDRVAFVRPLARGGRQRRFAAGHGRRGEAVHARRDCGCKRFAGVSRHRAEAGVALAADVHVLAAGQRDAAHGLAVDGQRAGLVAGDQAAAAEAFDRRQAADDDAAFAHALGRDRQRDGDGDGQALGDRRDRQRDGEEEHVVRRLAAQQRHGGDDEARGDDRDADVAGEALHAQHQRRRLGLGRGDGAGDAADLGARAGGDDDAFAAAALHGGAGERHASAVGDRRRRRQRRVGLVRRRRLAGQRRFVDREVAGGVQPQVRGHAVAGFDQHHVAGHEVLGIAHDDGAAAPDARPRRQQPLQVGGAALGPRFLPDADRGVERDDQQDEERVGAVAEQQGQQRRRAEHVQQRAAQLPEQQGEQRRALRLRQAVVAPARAARGRLRVVEPMCRGHGVAGGDVRGRQRVPCGAGDLGGGTGAVGSAWSRVTGRCRPRAVRHAGRRLRQGIVARQLGGIGHGGSPLGRRRGTVGVCRTEGHAARHAPSRPGSRRRALAHRPIRLGSQAWPQPRIHAPARRAFRDTDSYAKAGVRMLRRRT